jgi:DNA-binding NarL/FixJ family response regulator
MPKTIRTHLFCYDDHRGFSEDIRKRFADGDRYRVISFPTREELLDHLKAEQLHSFCKIAILSLHDNKEQYEMISQMTQEIKKIDHKTGLILIGPQEKMEDIKKAVKHNIDAYIPKNANSVLRIHNAVKKLISEHNIRVFKKRRNISLYVLISFFLLSAIVAFIAFFKAHQYF